MKKKNKSLGINAALNAFKSSLSILFPLITYPYVFRILHTEGIGKVNYATSVISYFSLLAELGISLYAVREGAKIRENKNEFNAFCNEIFSLNVLTTAGSYILLFAAAFFIKPLAEYRSLLFLLSLTIVFTTFGIEWINTIFEDFLYVTLRSIGTYILTLSLLFVLVRNESDYLKYAFLTVLTSGCICAFNWLHCRKYVHLKFTFRMNMQKHMRPVLTFFANSVAISIYVNSDTTMLGYYTGDHFVGLYALSVKVYNVIKTMLAAVYTVAVPRLAYFVGQNDRKSVKKVFTSLFSNLTIILLPAGIGLASISREIVLLMGGEEYLEATLTLQILAIALIGAIFGGAITNCLNIPLGREKVNAKATAMSAVINVLLNLVMIPVFKQNGAAFTTLIAEFFVAIYCAAEFKNIGDYLDLKEWSKKLLQAVIGCGMVVTITVLVKAFISTLAIRVLLIIAGSIVAYGVELILFKNELVFSVLNKCHLIRR